MMACFVVDREVVAQSLDDLARVIYRHVWGEDGELVATESRNDVTVAEGVAQNVGHCRDRLRTCLVTHRVVDLFQTVHVGVDEQRLRMGASRYPYGVFAQIAETAM